MRKLGYCGFAVSCCLSMLPFACSDSGATTPADAFGAGGDSNAKVGGSGSLGGNSSSGGTGAASQNQASGGTLRYTGSIDVSGTDTNTSIECMQNEVPIEALPPDILIVMDRSLSMTDDANGQICTGGSVSGDGKCGTASKWYQTIEAIKSVVQDTQDTVNWGMFWLGNESTTCGASTTPAVPIASGDSYTPIQGALDGNQFTGQIGTPTAAVVTNSIKYLKTLTDPNPKYLLVATDGEPNCPGGRSTSASSVGTVDSVGATNAVTEAAKAGYPTFVIGIATTSSATATDALNSMAVAGGNPQANGATQYYAVTDTESLKAVLRQIIGMATSCAISLEKTPTGEWNIAISTQDAAGDTIEIVNDPENGWAYTDEATKRNIELRGTACENLKTGKYSNLKFVYTCPDHKIQL